MTEIQHVACPRCAKSMAPTRVDTEYAAVHWHCLTCNVFVELPAYKFRRYCGHCVGAPMVLKHITNSQEVWQCQACSVWTFVDRKEASTRRPDYCSQCNARGTTLALDHIDDHYEHWRCIACNSWHRKDRKVMSDASVWQHTSMRNKPKPPKPCCRVCKFSKPVEAHIPDTQCLRHAPVTIYASPVGCLGIPPTLNTVWPPVSADAWCGDFERRAPEE